MIDASTKIIDLFPAEGDPLALRAPAPTKVKAEKIDAKRKQLLCIGLAFILVSRIAMHVNHTRTFDISLQILLCCKAAMKLLTFGIVDHKVISFAQDASICCSFCHSGVIWVR